ncbi:DUF1735 domain-containing protein [uncultured Polaribacter sp.]|uniref:BT_3987 domain-containing protein n=1 Tax=uncultured Polaribacter sp. TaxID=174711 RepID=UPI002613ED8F|nr:DUF1735 domain-containing protein [uncultured Polaribacter sp.]
MMKRNKINILKKLFVLAFITFITVSCYDDFVENEFDYTAVYFPQVTIDRTFIMGEGMRIGVGVVLGGRLVNTEDVEVTFSLSDTLLGTKTRLPDNYYQFLDSEGNLANNKITIPAGKSQGFVFVKADSINFLSDPMSLGNNYALGFGLDNVVGADSILVDLKTTKITFTYINQLFGNYIQKGQFTKTPLDDPNTPEDESGPTETIVYPGQITDVLELTMVSPTTLEYSGIADLRGADKKLNITVAADNSITIQTATGGIPVVDENGSSYNPQTRELILNYSFDFNGNSYNCSDVLEFRNRIVDGVNQFDI